MERQAATYADAISLAQGIPYFDTFSAIKDSAKEAMDRGGAARYSTPQGLIKLRQLIAAHLSRQKINYGQSEILVTAGSIEAMTVALMTVTMPGDEVIVFDPSYTAYDSIITLAGCVSVHVNLDEENGWSFDLNKLKKVINKKTKAIVVCNPNNPTGTMFSKNQLIEIGELALENGLFVITDEVYKEFVYDNGGMPAFSLAEIDKYKKNLISIFSFSKSYAMTGWRIGYLCASVEVINEALKIHDCFVNCAPVISQYAAMAALEMENDDRKSVFEGYAESRKLICTRLDKLARFFSYVKPTGTYYIFPKLLGNKNSEDFAKDLLSKTHVALVPGIAFGKNGEEHVRLSFGGKKDGINAAFDRIEKYFGL